MHEIRNPNVFFYVHFISSCALCIFDLNLLIFWVISVLSFFLCVLPSFGLSVVIVVCQFVYPSRRRAFVFLTFFFFFNADLLNLSKWNCHSGTRFEWCSKNIHIFICSYCRNGKGHSPYTRICMNFQKWQNNNGVCLLRSIAKREINIKIGFSSPKKANLRINEKTYEFSS